MRALSVHPDVVVVVSAVWQTTCTAVRAGEEGFLIDSPVLPEELEALPGVLEQAGFPVSGLLVSHADWDHLLGRLAFPHSALGCAQSSAARLAAEPAAAQRALRRFDEEHYIERPRGLGLAGVQGLPVPGGVGLGEQQELALHPAAGHTSDGMAVWMPWTRTLICGDYLSPVEIPMLSPGGSLEAYLDTLERLAPLVEEAEAIVPGHGAPLDRDAASRLLSEDVEYLRSLAGSGIAAPLPPGRRTHEQRRIHAENATARSAVPKRS